MFPHNLRHLFATTYYRMKKDISKLADLLGHSTSQITELYYVKKDTARLSGITEGFEI